MSDNLFSSFAAAIAVPDRVFIAPLHREAITFRRAFDFAGRFAHVLASHGVKRGDRVVAHIEKSPEAVFLYFACLRLGAIYVPLNPAYTVGELDYLLADAEPGLLVSAPEKEASSRAILLRRPVLTLGDDGKSGSLLVEAMNKPAAFTDAVVASDDLAAILYTSGTTGRSKGAMLSHGNLKSNALVLKEVWQFQSTDVLLHALPIFHTHGLFVAINISLAAASSLIFLPKFDVDEIFRQLSHASVMMGVPTFYARLLADPRLDRAEVRHMRLFLSGSAPLPLELFTRWRERTGLTLLERYGMTETNMNTSNPYFGERKLGTVGLPLPGTEIRIVDDKGHAVPQGEVGMITVRGPNVFKGYWRMPEKTEADFQDGFFVTGDLGRKDEDGYISIVGRGKDLVITGGLNVYPREVETCLNMVPGVQDSAVFGLPHPDLGEGVTAAVVYRGEGNLSEAAVMASLGERLAKFKRPKRILFVDEIPRNAMGKVQKNLLQEKYSTLYTGGDVQKPPPVQREL